jgi:TPR repeat protein
MVPVIRFAGLTLDGRHIRNVIPGRPATSAPRPIDVIPASLDVIPRLPSSSSPDLFGDLLRTSPRGNILDTLQKEILVTERAILARLMRVAATRRARSALIGAIMSMLSIWPFAFAHAGVPFRNGIDHRSSPFRFIADQGTLAQAQAAFQAGDVLTARRIWVALADHGDPEAQYQLGVLSETQGSDNDFAEAAAWYTKAAASKYAPAQRNLAILYETGRGVPQNNAMARDWYGKAAALGDALALTHLGIMQYRGLGGARDIPSSVDSFTKAAELGVARAQFDLGTMYETSKGVTADPVMAASLYRQAANQNFAPALSSLGLLLAKGEGVKRDLTVAHDNFRRAAELGDVRGQYYLAVDYRLGKGVLADPIAALRWFAIASGHGNIDAVRQRNELMNEMSKPDVEQALRQAEDWQPEVMKK